MWKRKANKRIKSYESSTKKTHTEDATKFAKTECKKKVLQQNYQKKMKKQENEEKTIEICLNCFYCAKFWNVWKRQK